MRGEKDVLAGYAALNPARGCFVDLIGEGKEHLGSRVSAERTAALRSPIEFQPPRGGRTAYGYRAEMLEGIIDAIIDADRAGALPDRYAHIVQRADILSRGLRHTGIVGLIDEATGYQRIRSERALATILQLDLDFGDDE